MNNILVSVIVPCYNGEKYIVNFRNMFDKMDLGEIQILVVNDGSTDNSLELLKKWEAENEHVEVISQKKKGVSAARNVGINNAKGEWITFCDIDDDISADFVDVTRNTSNADAEIVCYARQSYADNTSERMTEIKDKKQLLLYFLECANIENLGNRYLLPLAFSKLYKKSFLVNKELFFSEGMKILEDAIFVLKCILNSEKILFSDKGFYRYVQRENSTIHSRRRDDLKNGLRIYKEIGNVVNAYFDLLDDEVITALNIWIMKRIFICIGSAIGRFSDEYSLGKMVQLLNEFKQEIGYKDIAKINIKDKYKWVGMAQKLKIMCVDKAPLIWCMFLKIKYRGKN